MPQRHCWRRSRCQPADPAPAPIAAPAPAAPLAAPIAAPVAAPSAVPTTALPTALCDAATPGDAPPVCCQANWRQNTSSCWNASKFLPWPGSAMTDGPGGGGTTHASSARAMPGASRITTRFMRRFLAMTVGGVHASYTNVAALAASKCARTETWRCAPDTIPDRQDSLIIACGGRCSAKLIAHVAQRSRHAAACNAVPPRRACHARTHARACANV